MLTLLWGTEKNIAIVNYRLNRPRGRQSENVFSREKLQLQVCKLMATLLDIGFMHGPSSKVYSKGEAVSIVTGCDPIILKGYRCERSLDFQSPYKTHFHIRAVHILCQPPGGWGLGDSAIYFYFFLTRGEGWLANF